MSYSFRTHAMQNAKDTVQNRHAARPARWRVNANGFRNLRTGITFAGQRMSSGFGNGVRHIPPGLCCSAKPMDVTEKAGFKYLWIYWLSPFPA